jgi:mRNA interferase MazF
MTSPSRGDVVLVSFVFAGEGAAKLRPAVVLSGPAYQRKRQAAIVAAITGHRAGRFLGDHLIEDWKEAGLIRPSYVTGIVRTIRNTMINKRLGTVTRRDMNGIDREYRRYLGF